MELDPEPLPSLAPAGSFEDGICTVTDSSTFLSGSDVHSERFFQKPVVYRKSERPTRGILKLPAAIFLLLGLFGLLAVGKEEPLAGVNTLAAVKAGVPAEFGSGVSAVVNDYRAVNVQASAPGESSGPAIAVTMEVSNESGVDVDLSQLSVTASDSQGLPALPIESEQAAALEGALESGASRTGVYVFRLNEERSPSLLLNVQAGFSPNALQFELK